MQTIKHRRAIRAFSANDPRVVRVSNHRDPQWIEGPCPDYSAGDRFVGWLLAVIAAGVFVMLVAGAL